MRLSSLFAQCSRPSRIGVKKYAVFWRVAAGLSSTAVGRGAHKGKSQGKNAGLSGVYTNARLRFQKAVELTQEVLPGGFVCQQDVVLAFQRHKTGIGNE